jgi:endonuclease/exonuclease/phosphatase family metal-dependent hydrolase
MSTVVCSPIRTLPLIRQFVVASIAICGFAAGVSAQTTVTLSTPRTHINADVTIQGGSSGNVNFGTRDTVATKVSSESYTRRILLKFDTQNFIPPNAVIQRAELQLVLKKAENTENRPLTAYYVTKSFGNDDATWYQYRAGQRWSTAGGDYGASFGTTYVGSAIGSTYKFDLTTLVQKTVNGEFGSRYTRVALIDSGAYSDGTYREFHSTRASNSALRPRLVITYGGSSTTQPTTTTPTTTTTSGTTLRVMQWNIHKTKGSDGACNPDRIANGIVAQNPHVVGINEVNFFSGVCAWNFDMGEKLHNLLQQKTGVTWYRQHVNSGGVGNVLYSRIRPVSSGSTQLSYSRGVAQMTIVVNGRNVNLLVTHVDYENASYRTIQTKEVVRWATTFSEPRIVMGDFNTWPSTSDYWLMATPYQDAWVAGQSAGTAWAFNGSGATHGGSRFDYVYYSRVTALSLKSVKVPDMRVSGVWPSDHHPVVAEFIVK